MDTSNLKDLLRKHMAGTLSESERLRLWMELDKPENAANAKATIQELSQEATGNKNYNPEEWEEMIRSILRSDKVKAPVLSIRHNRSRIRWIAAAAVSILLAGTWLLTPHHPEKTDLVKKALAVTDIAPPSGTRATLTLGNGRQIILDSVKNGTLAIQGNANILKLDSNQLSYESLTGKPAEIEYNTLSTAKGGQTMVTLADGSKVWLNSLSSLKFPTAFYGNDRRVELTGEGYFEVARNAKMSFHVLVNQEDVQVLGTHFNVNAYADESSTKTTLLEGSVKVSRDRKEALLKPGQQAVINNETGAVRLINGADLEEALAWKNGLFEFSSIDIKSIMRQVGRWYDVEISYDGDIPADRFTGIVNRSSNLSQVLMIMEQANVHFTIKKNKIIVRP